MLAMDHIPKVMEIQDLLRCPSNVHSLSHRTRPDILLSACFCHEGMKGKAASLNNTFFPSLGSVSYGNSDTDYRHTEYTGGTGEEGVETAGGT